MAWRRPASPLAAAVLALAVTIAVAGCGRSAGHGPQAAPVTGAQAGAQPSTSSRTGASQATGATAGTLPAGKVAFAALATTDVTVLSAPASNDVVALFPATQRAGVPTPFLVEQQREQAGRRWIQVLLPRRPNESTGWIRGDQVRLVALSRQVEVDLSARTLSLFQGDRLVRRVPVAVGRPGTPTPTGRFFITIKLRPPEISRVYGNWALGLSGYSDVLDQFGTGNGQIALHGTSDLAQLGRAVSHGCVRLDNAAITNLARLLPLGTPVTIRR